ncbi:MAG: fibronectin type III domain-containing protein, partial [Chitinophagales bacterium]
MGTFFTQVGRRIVSLSILTILLSMVATAQVAQYQFSQSSTPYTALATSTVVHASGWDDNQATVTIPFSFTFNGTAYTACRVSSNGFITFNSNPGTSNYAPLSSTTTYTGAVAGFARDLISNSSTIVYGTEGVSPNQVFVIQWNNARRYSGGAIGGDVLNFQIRLYQTTNVVEVRYGTCTATSTTVLTVQCGLRGANNADFSPRTLTAPAGWSSTDLGQANSATLNTSDVLMPASGLTFTWTPAACAIPTAINVTSPTTTGATINWTAASPAPGSGYNWKVTLPNSGSEGTAVSSGSVAAGVVTANAGGLASNTTYTAYVRSNCGSTGSSWNGPISFTTASSIPPNCGTLTTPANASTLSCGPATLVWTAPATGPAPTGYKVYLGTDGAGVTTPTNVINGVNVGLLTSTPLTGLAPSTTYYWQVIPSNAAGDATGCSIFSFTTPATPLPEVATPIFDDFEGTCPEWTIVNGSQTNKWIIGSATNNGGSKSIYISNDNGVTNTYSLTSQSIVHFYRTVAIPAGNTDINLKFDWKGQGESTWDRILVYTAPLSVTPDNTAPAPNSTTLTGATLIGTYNLSGSFATVNVALPAALAGTTFRLIFSWQNDGGGGTATPAGALDNISLTAVVPAPPGCINSAVPATGATGICQAGSLTWTSPSSGGTPTGYKLYFGTDGGGVTAPTTIVNGTNLGAVTSYAFTGLAASTTYYWQVIPTNAIGDATGCPIRSFTTGPAPETTTPVSDNFEGCPEWTLVNGTQTNKWVVGTATNNGGSKCIYISNDNGVTNAYTGTQSIVHFYRDITVPAGNTDINLSFDWKCAGESTWDRILVYTAPTSVTPTSTAPAPNSTTLTGAALVGTYNLNGGAYTTVSTALPAALAGTTFRLIFSWQNDGTTTNNPAGAIDNISVTSSAPSVPGCISTAFPATGATGICTLSSLTWSAPSSGGTPTGYKLYVGTNGGGVSTPTNLINGTNLGLVTSYLLSGLAANTVYYWQVVPTNAIGDATGCPIRSFTTVTSGPETTTPVSDNFEGCPEWTIVNGTQTNKWVVGSATNNGGTKGMYISNDNGVTNAYTGTSSIVHFYRDITVPAGYNNINLAFDWKCAGESSWDRILVYTAPTSLTPDNTAPTPNSTTLTGATLVGTYNLNGTSYTTVNATLPAALAGTTFRLIFSWQNDGITTNNPAGAIDNISVTAQPGPPAITYTPLSTTCGTSDRTLSATITSVVGIPTSGGNVPRIYFKKNAGAYVSAAGTLSSGSGTNGIWNFTISSAALGGVSGGDVISYYVIAEDVSTPTVKVSSSPSAGLVATGVNSVTTAPTTPNTYTIGSTLAGTYTVGTGGNYTTLTAAINAFNSACLTGPVVFELISPTYTAGETFPVIVNANSYSSAVNTLTIRPASGVNAAITGSVATGALITILNSNTFVDGSNNGSTTRNLTITNTGATSPAILVVGSTGTTPITNVTLKNFIAKNGSQDYTGIYVSDGATPANAGYFNNITIQNLDVRNCYGAIYANATVAAG